MYDPNNPDTYDPELKAYYSKIKQSIATSHEQYMDSHPEIRTILTDFTSSLLLEKPDNIYKFAQHYFSFFNIDAKNIHPLNVIIVSDLSDKVAKIVANINEINLIPNQKLEYCIVWTNRKIKPYEINGQEYYFKNNQEIDLEKNQGGFIEEVNQNGSFYGIAKRTISSIIERGNICVFSVNIDGAKQLQKQFPNSIIIYLANTSSKTLSQELVRKLFQINQYMFFKRKITQEEVQKLVETQQKNIKEIDSINGIKKIMTDDIESTKQQIAKLLSDQLKKK